MPESTMTWLCSDVSHRFGGKITATKLTHGHFTFCITIQRYQHCSIYLCGGMSQLPIIVVLTLFIYFYFVGEITTSNVQDVNECTATEPLIKNHCTSDATCENSAGLYDCVCENGQKGKCYLTVCQQN